MALRGVELALYPGAIHALIGPNGSGKTTMLNVISGLTKLDSGSIKLDGEEVVKYSADRRARLGIGRSFQSPQAMGGFTCCEFVMSGWVTGRAGPISSMLASPKSGRHERVARHRAEALLGDLGLGHLCDLSMAAVTVADVKLLDVARVIVAEPKVLLLDEPAAGLDSAGLSSVLQILDRLIETGTAILLVEHDTELVRSVAQWTTVLSEGGVIFSGPPEHTIADPGVRAAYFGTIDVEAPVAG